jgi:transcriptional regulator with XRE-family HTH domain
MLMASIQQWAVTMTPQDKRFCQELGQRIAGFRNAQNLTQQQLAEILGISQQTMAHYEVGRLRASVAMLSPLARAAHRGVIHSPQGQTRTSFEVTTADRADQSAAPRQAEVCHRDA